MAHHDELDIKRDVLKKFVPSLKDVLKYGNLSCHLHEIKLSPAELERLRCLNSNEGGTAAIESLLQDHFRLRIRYWDEFLAILRRCDYRDEADKLENEFQKRIRRRQGHSQHHKPPTDPVPHSEPPHLHLPRHQQSDVLNFPATPTSSPPWIQDQRDKLTNQAVVNEPGKTTDRTVHVQVSDTQDYNNPSNIHVYENDVAAENIDADSVKETPNTKEMPIQTVGESASNTNLELDLVKECPSGICSSEELLTSDYHSSDSYWCSDSRGTTIEQRVARVQQLADDCLEEDTCFKEVVQAPNGAQSSTIERGEKSLSRIVKYEVTTDGITGFVPFDKLNSPQQQNEQKDRSQQPERQLWQGQQQQQEEQQKLQQQQDQQQELKEQQLQMEQQLQQRQQQFENQVATGAGVEIPCVVDRFQTPSVSSESFGLEYSEKEEQRDNNAGNDLGDGAGGTFQPNGYAGDTPKKVSEMEHQRDGHAGKDLVDDAGGTIQPSNFAAVDPECAASPALKPEGKWLPVRNETTIVVQSYQSERDVGTANLINTATNVPAHRPGSLVDEEESNVATDDQSGVMGKAPEPQGRSVSFDPEEYNMEDINRGFNLLNIIAGSLAIGAMIAMYWK